MEAPFQATSEPIGPSRDLQGLQGMLGVRAMRGTRRGWGNETAAVKALKAVYARDEDGGQ